MRLGIASRNWKKWLTAVPPATAYRDGTVKYIRNSYAAFLEACDGIDTPRARVMLTAVDCVTSGGGQLHALAQSVVGEGPAVEHPITRPMEPNQ